MPTPMDILHALAQDHLAGQLSMRDLQVVSLICQEPDEELRTTAAIGTKLNLTANAMVRAGHRLEDKGLIIRTATASNLKRVVFTPTALARAMDQRVQMLFINPNVAKRRSRGAA